MKISILSKPNNIFSKSSIKRAARILFRKSDGPKGVEESLKRGLKIINNIEYNFNPVPQKVYENVIVIQGLDTLQYALELKREGRIKKIYAGPNIILSTDDKGGILRNNKIYKMIVPSKWVKDFYVSKSPEIKNKIEIWPAGVENVKDTTNKSGDFILYYKNAPLELLEYIKDSLNKKNIKWNLIKYGKYKKDDYFECLKTAKGVIFLSPSESQGLALQEAWIRDVPTLVWNIGCTQIKNMKWCDEKISAPYLSDESGMFFKNEKDFNDKLNVFLSKNFQPKKYCLENLTDEISVKKLLEIIKR